MKYTKVPPDGGYGWVIVFANGLSNFLSISFLPCFGLIFKDTFAELGLTATQGSLILNLNGACGKLIGPITGVILKVFGCRRTGLVSAALFTLGMVLTAYSRSFVAFVLSYGLITSLGMQMSESTYRLALNLYFKEKRSIAMGFAVAASGFGPILMPQLTSLLIDFYPPEQVTLIMAGVAAHVFISAIVVQPVKWHMKTVEVDKEVQEELLEKEVKTEVPVEESFLKRMVNSVVQIFDLDLLKDPIFDNLLLGVSLAIFAELNFTLLLPFMLNDFGLTTEEIAIVLSTTGVADLILRFCAPYIGNYFTKPSRLMYAYSLILLVSIRFALLFTTNFWFITVIAFGLGVAKGVRKVYMYLVIADYVPMEKLASAGGMEMLANGICILIGGPILGALRDITGSYIICIVVMNLVTLVTILLWCAEYLIVRYRKRKSLVPNKPIN